MNNVMFLSLVLTLLCVSDISAHGSFLPDLTTAQRHIFEPLIVRPIPFDTQQPELQRHLVPPRQTQFSSLQQQKQDFEWDDEFVPVDFQPQHDQENQQGHVRNYEEKPFGESEHQSDWYYPYDGFGIPQKPWYNGPNVCREKKVIERTLEGGEETETSVGIENDFDDFKDAESSCTEEPNKAVCTRVVNTDGKMKILFISHQCCHGYGRSRYAAYETPCEKIKDIESTAADMGAKEFVAKAKSNGLADTIQTLKNVTFFLPLDEAFTAYTDSVQSTNDLAETKSDEGMKQLYLRHIVDGDISLDDMPNEQVLKSQVAGQTIRINSYPLPYGGNEPFHYTVNCVPIEKHDKLTEQGMIHTLAGVIKPATKNVMDIIRERADMSIMRTVLENSKLSELLEGEKPVTIFVPTDDAFGKLEPQFRRGLKKSNGCASNILKNHILGMTFCSVAFAPAPLATKYNLLGKSLSFIRSEPTESESKDQKTEQQPIVVNGIAKIIEADIMGSNGVLHVIDTIMPTELALPLSSLMQKKNVTVFKRLFEATGLDNKLDDMENVTIFAPTNNALQNTKWAKLLDEAPEHLKDNRELIDFLYYHIAHPKINFNGLKNQKQLLSTVGGDKIRINSYHPIGFYYNNVPGVTVNCARLVHSNDESCGSVLHQVEKPLQPVKQNLLEVLESNPNYSKFLHLVRMTNLTDLLSNPEGDYTLMVPKNDVFDELEDSLLKNEAKLENIIKTHIVDHIVCCADIIPPQWPFHVSIKSLNGHRLSRNRDRRPRIQNADVTKCDTIATNGIIHEINDVIVHQNNEMI